MATAWGSWAALRLHAQCKGLQLQTVSMSEAAHIPRDALPVDFTANLGPPVADGKLLQLLDGAALGADKALHMQDHLRRP